MRREEQMTLSTEDTHTHTSKTNLYDEIELLRRLLRSSSSSFKEKKEEGKNSILFLIMGGAARVEKL